MTHDLNGTHGLIVGIANKRSLAWSIAQALSSAGATLALTYQSERLEENVRDLGGTLAREWMRQDHAAHLVRRLVTIDSPSHGIISCSPNPANYWQAPASGGFTPDSAVCREYVPSALPTS